MIRDALRNVVHRVRRLHLDLGRDWVLIIYGAIIGTVTACGAVGFAKALHWTEHACYEQQRSWSIWVLPLLPMAGALITGVLVHTFAKDAEGHGVPQVIDAIARRGGKISWKVGVIKVLASIATVGTGGSAGAEGPIVQIGSTSGSVFGQLARANRVDLSTLVGCGAAAGIASIFNAPITGVLFALEILLRDFSLKTFTPIMVASVFSTAVTQTLLHNQDAIFAVELTGYVFTLAEMPSYVLLGLLCVLVSVGMTRLLHLSEDLFAKVKVPRIVLPVLGAALLGLTGIVWVFIMRGYGADQRVPPFFGNGYPTIVRLVEPGTYEPVVTLTTPNETMDTKAEAVFADVEQEQGLDAAHEASAEADTPPLFVTVLVLLTLFKALGTCLTLGSGGSGGVFAPSLYIGATTGAAFGLLLEHLSLMPSGVTPASYALVGMAAVIAGTTFAPLTAILLLFELTREPFVMMPAMLTSIIAAIGSHLWMHDSIYTMKLRQAGVLLGSGRDLTIMRRVQARTVPPTPLPAEPIYASDPLSKLISMHMPRTAPDFVVVDEHGMYLGMVTGEDLRTALVDREAIPLLLVAELLRTDLPTVDPEEMLDTVLDKFAEHDVASLCLMSPREGSKPIGLITRARVIRCYQEAIEAS